MYYMRFLASIIFLLLGYCVLAQHVLVKDAVTLEPLLGVNIVDSDKSHMQITDQIGRASLNTFDNKAKLLFTYMGYESISLNKNQIKPNQVVLMSPNLEQLGEIVLSVSRSSENKKRLAQQVGVLSQEEIAKQNPESTATLLREVPSVRVQQSQGGGGSPVLRGFEANRVLLVVDGVRLNNAIFRSGHVHNSITVDPLSLSRAEVIFGPSSVGYGSDALGGVIHFYTRTPLINQDKRTNFSGSSSYTFNQNTTKQSAILEYSATNWAVLQKISFSQFGDVVMGKRRPHGYENWGKVFEYSQNTNDAYIASPSKNDNPNIQRGSAYEQVDMLQKWIYHTPNGVKYTLNLQASKSGNIPRFDKLTEKRDGALRFARWDYGPQSRVLISPQISFAGNRTLLHSGKIIAAVQLLEESRIKRKFNSLSREKQKENLTVYSLNADFKAKTKEGRDWSYGLEITHNEVRSSAFAQELLINASIITGTEPKVPITTRYPSAGSTYSTFAAYVDYRHDLSPKSTFTVGGRHTLTKLDARWTEQALIDAHLAHAYQKHQSSSATLGYTYQPTSLWQLKALLSTGFRAPNIDDLGKTREDKGILSVPNIDLKPEYIYSADLGLRRQWNNGSFVELNGYYAFVQDYIARSPYQLLQDKSTPDLNTIRYSGDEVITYANINVGAVRVSGLNGTAKWQISPKSSYQITFTLNKGVGNELSGNLPSISPLFINQKCAVHIKKAAISLHWRHARAKAPDAYSRWGEDGLEETPLLSENNYAGTPSWHQWDIQFNLPLSRAIKLSGGVFNVFDTHYREFASGISAPGRSTKLVLRYDL